MEKETWRPQRRDESFQSGLRPAHSESRSQNARRPLNVSVLTARAVGLPQQRQATNRPPRLQAPRLPPVGQEVGEGGQHAGVPRVTAKREVGVGVAVAVAVGVADDVVAQQP